MSSEVSASQSQDSLFYSKAFWVSKSIIALNVNVGYGSCYLYASKIAALSLADNGIQGLDTGQYLFKAFSAPSAVDARSLLKCQLAVAVCTCKISFSGLKGKVLSRNRNFDFCRGHLFHDQLFAYDGPLVAVYSEGAVSLYLWAPTAQEVYARIFKDPNSWDPMDVVRLDAANGVWSTRGPKSLESCYYVYEVSVYHPSTLQIEKCIATDPCARGLSSDGARALFVSLEDEALKPY
ncbi:Glycoside hydrolase, family 13, N-terminal [Dillenia turbinata]|uniref:Glycoside hydrolase, family 13, N-terminal n=1 Tax=Dillenia turbinata TaxID=194707 RepID=A0AAN8ZGU0_9MAGN